MKTALRLDWQVTTEGMEGGLPFQSTEFIDVTDKTREEIQQLVRQRIPNDPQSPHVLQGGVIIRDYDGRFGTFDFNL